MADRNSLTATQLRALLYYDPDLGFFMWLVAPQISGKIKPGDIAGRVDSKGYVRIGVLGHQYRAHRLAWLYMTGDWPFCEIDHEDRQRTHNRWKNLRLATTGQNRQNMSPRSDNRSGATGVFWSSKRHQWVAQITNDKKRKTIGSFDDLESAIQARRKTERLIFSHAPKYFQAH